MPFGLQQKKDTIIILELFHLIKKKQNNFLLLWKKDYVIFLP